MTKQARSYSLLLAIFGTLLAVSQPTQAADLAWSGQYRAEALMVKNPEAAGDRSKTYLLHHMTLAPRIVAADGVTIYSRLELFNFGQPYQNSQLGQVFGSGPRGYDSTTPSNNTIGGPDANNVLGQNGANELITVSQLYLQWAQEYGSLVVGRVPLQFGLGMTHNAGTSQFDHWFDTRDVVGYKMVFGNLFAMPMYGKMYEGDLGHGDDVIDYILQLGYENPETGLAIGLFGEWRVATKSGTDTPVVTPAGPTNTIGGPNATVGTESYTHQLVNLFVRKPFGNFRFGFEGGMLTGDAGVVTAGGAPVKMSGYGLAAELTYQKPESRWDYGLRAGIATGDDPSTDDEYEGFVFDRNYDVAFLMFNHPLGRTDVLRTGGFRDTTTTASSLPDTEAISNTMYVSPRFNQRIGERMSWGGNVTWASAGEDAFASGGGGDLGFEIDLNFTYRPYERLTLITEAGFLLPGDAWSQDNTAAPTDDKKFIYGVTTKAAISF